jgi:hypothetical protein
MIAPFFFLVFQGEKETLNNVLKLTKQGLIFLGQV